MSQRDFSEVEPEGTSELPAASRALFLEKVRQSNAACQSGDFATAVSSYTDALSLDPSNHILYSNRSAARLKQGHFSLALQDATRARELCPTWPKAYYRQGVALQCLGRHGEALAAFSSGLAQDPSSRQLLAGLVEASVKSPLRATLEPTFQQLQTMKLDQSPFVVISVVGQELLGAGHYNAAVTVLESALRIGSCSLKLRGSVFSALSSAHWALSQLDKAIGYMQQDLAVAKSLGDTAGECRAHGNLGSAYFSQGSFKEALTAHRYQLVLAMKCKDTQAAAAALTSLGHVYTAVGDYPNALASHKQCVQLVKQMGDRLQEAREIGNVGAVYLAMGEFDSAVDCHTQHLRLAKRLGNQVEEARAYSNLGSSHHYRRNFSQAIAFHENVLRIAQSLGDRAVEARAYAGLGHAARCAGDYVHAKRWHERQLDMALAARDKVGEGRACSNLGIVYQLLGEHDAALKLHQAHLTIARNLQDRAGMGRAYGNIGNAYSAAGFYESAIKYHKQELTISKEVHDRPSEASTHGNLAVAYQALGAHDMALMHYRAHLGIARELKDTAGEACALLNLGNCLSSRSEFAQAVPYYEQHLMLSQELGDVAAEGKACHFLGYAHYCIGNYREAVRYYDQDLALAKDLQDKMNMGRAYCNLGLAHIALGQLDIALECQKYFLAIAHMTQHLPGKFRALGNIGDVLIKTGDVEEAVKMYHRQLGFARQARERGLEAAACGALGLANRLLRRFDKALGYHTQELTLRQEMADLSGECRAHGHLGAVHMSLGNYTHAVKCYQEQLERAQELQDCGVEAQAFGNLGIARLNMGHYEDAIGYLEQQLGTLEQLSSPTAQLDRARAFGSLGDCYDSLGDHEEALKCHEQHLTLSLKLKSYRDQERAYRGLGHTHRSLGNLQQALVCLEKRLVVAHELGSPEAKGAAYGDLGAIHSTLGNLEQAVSCLEHQKEIARELNDCIGESDAVSGLGIVHQLLGDLPVALRLHQSDLERVTELGLTSLQGRACGNLGSVHESLGNFSEAVRFLEQHLQIAINTGDKLGKALACSSLGRVLHAMGNSQQAVGYLAQGLAIAEALGKREEEARIRHRLGLSLWSGGDLDGAQKHLGAACSLLEGLRRDPKSPTEHRTALYELQSSCYQSVQRVLVALGRHEDALVIAEQSRTRALVDLLLERQGHVDSLRQTRVSATSRIEECTSITISNLLETVNRQKASVLYYSLAGTSLYSWLLVPTKGVVRFHETLLVHEGHGDDKSSGSLLEHYIQSVRDSLGIELSTPRDNRETDDAWGHMEDMSNERAGFLRMVNRNHLLNSSNYSLSSLFSLGSVGGSVASLQGSTRSSASLQGSTRSRRATQPSWQGPACLNALYAMLIAPFEDLLPNSQNSCQNNKLNTGRRELILVLDGDLYLVPYPVLRANQEGGIQSCEYLSERFCLLAVPSLGTLRSTKSVKVKNESNDGVSALVVGSPRIPAAVTEHWGWGDIPTALQEAAMVAEMLHSKALMGAQATKESVLSQLCSAECIHLATHVSWKLSAVVLSPGEMLDSQSQGKRFFGGAEGLGECEEESSELSTGNLEPCLPPLSDFLLSANDLLGLKLQARLVVISAPPSRDPHNWASGSGLIGLVGALLASGVQAVLLSLWPVPDTATRILLKAFYSAMLQGARAARALAEAMQTVQHTKHFAHPANWAGFLLIGANVRLSNKVALMGQALCELLRVPDKCRDALRVSLHLVEKSLQRIHRGQKNAMYTTQKSIENKVGAVPGWKELLMSVGFRFEPAANGIPSSVFFPQSDPEDRLTQCSASLQALLGLTTTSLNALSKLITNVDVAEDIIAVVRAVIAQFSLKNIETESIETALSVRLWRVAGCHELLASLGFDLMEVGQDEVTLRTGKQANRRHVQFVLQALLALFDTQEAPRSLSLDSSSSLESLASEENESNAPAASLQRSTSSPNIAQSVAMALPPPPLPFSRSILLPGGRLTSGGAFTSYVRRRGEPDGRTENPTDTRTLPANITSNNHSLATTTDSDLSDNGGYNLNVNVNNASVSLTRAATSQNLSKFGLQRPPVKVSRPGGGGESDAAFTPSPPVQNMDLIPNSNVTLALAHQTRIRSLYHNNMNQNVMLDSDNGHDRVIGKGLRPDSSSSASSATDWESSGHATVLRRTSYSSHQMPPLPPPRQVLHGASGPLVEDLHPLPPVYNNLSNLGGAFESTSSDSDFERSFEQRNNKPMYKTNAVQRKITQAPIVAIDRLSVRTEITPISMQPHTNRKPLTLPNEEIMSTSSNLYFSPTEQNAAEQTTIKSPEKVKENKTKKESSGTPSSGTIQDTILASQLRHINRELTPTISDVYHERNIGLGLAPPLSKLLLNNQSLGVPSNENIITGLEKIKLNILEENVQEKESSRCEICNRITETNTVCLCSKKKTLATKPWLSGTALNTNIVKGSDLTTADILERQHKMKQVNSETTYSNKGCEYDIRNSEPETVLEQQTRTISPFSEMSRRDEGDGRSVADSQCSSTYKLLVNNTNRTMYMVNQNIEESTDTMSEKGAAKTKIKITSTQQRKKYNLE